MDYEKMCMGCMREKNGQDQKCPYCGFDEKQFVAPAYSLVNRSILNGKYMTGRFLEESGYFITYLGWDLNLEINVMIHEYYPCTMLWRDDMTQPGVGCRPEDQEAFANGKRKFFTRAKVLARMWDLPGVVSVKDVFEENDTVYMITEYYQGMLLDEKLKEAGGRLDADTVLYWMEPVMQAVSRLNREGIICMGISPGNILITTEGSGKLKEIWNPTAISPYDEGGSVPAGNSYLAEEEYRKDKDPGPWTNVYAVCAVIYRCITGSAPPKAMERIIYDSIVPPSGLGFNMGKVREEALMRGLAIHADDRCQNMEQLMEGLYRSDAPRPVPQSAPGPVPQPGAHPMPRPGVNYRVDNVTRPVSDDMTRPLPPGRPGGTEQRETAASAGEGRHAGMGTKNGPGASGGRKWLKWQAFAAAAAVLLCSACVFFFVRNGGSGGDKIQTGTVPAEQETVQARQNRSDTEAPAAEKDTRKPDGTGQGSEAGQGTGSGQNDGTGGQSAEGNGYSWDPQEPEVNGNGTGRDEPSGEQDGLNQEDWVYGGADFPCLDSVISRFADDRCVEYGWDEVIVADNYIMYLLDYAEIQRDERSGQNYLMVEMEMCTSEGSPYSSLLVADYNFAALVMDASAERLVICLPSMYFLSSDEETPRYFPIEVGSESAGEIILVYPIPDWYDSWGIMETNMHNGEEAGPLYLVSGQDD